MNFVHTWKHTSCEKWSAISGPSRWIRACIIPKSSLNVVRTWTGTEWFRARSRELARVSVATQAGRGRDVRFARAKRWAAACMSMRSIKFHLHPSPSKTATSGRGGPISINAPGPPHFLHFFPHSIFPLHSRALRWLSGPRTRCKSVPRPAYSAPATMYWIAEYERATLYLGTRYKA